MNHPGVCVKEQVFWDTQTVACVRLVNQLGLDISSLAPESAVNSAWLKLRAKLREEFLLR